MHTPHDCTRVHRHKHTTAAQSLILRAPSLRHPVHHHLQHAPHGPPHSSPSASPSAAHAAAATSNPNACLTLSHPAAVPRPRLTRWAAGILPPRHPMPRATSHHQPPPAAIAAPLRVLGLPNTTHTHTTHTHAHTHSPQKVMVRCMTGGPLPLSDHDDLLQLLSPPRDLTT